MCQRESLQPRNWELFSVWAPSASPGIRSRSANGETFPPQFLVLVLCFIDTPRYRVSVQRLKWRHRKRWHSNSWGGEATHSYWALGTKNEPIGLVRAWSQSRGSTGQIWTVASSILFQPQKFVNGKSSLRRPLATSSIFLTMAIPSEMSCLHLPICQWYSHIIIHVPPILVCPNIGSPKLRCKTSLLKKGWSNMHGKIHDLVCIPTVYTLYLIIFYKSVRELP